MLLSTEPGRFKVANPSPLNIQVRKAKAGVRESMNAAKAAREAAEAAEAEAAGRPPHPVWVAAAAPRNKGLLATASAEVAAGKPLLKAFQKTRDQEPGNARPPELRLKHRKPAAVLHPQQP